MTAISFSSDRTCLSSLAISVAFDDGGVFCGASVTRKAPTEPSRAAYSKAAIRSLRTSGPFPCLVASSTRSERSLLYLDGADLARRALGSAHTALVLAYEGEAVLYEALEVPLLCYRVIEGPEAAVGFGYLVDHRAALLRHAHLELDFAAT